MPSRQVSDQTLSAIQLALDYIFRKPDLLCLALTHKSANETNNERLEFLGDAVLELFVSLELFSRFANANEGQLTRARSNIVKRESLAKSAREINLGAFLNLGEGEQKSGGWQRSSILADALEALIGAVYIDGGAQACHRVVKKLLARYLEAADPDTIGKDAKTELQEYLQRKGITLPKYQVHNVTGPSHEQIFTISCSVEALKKTEMAQGSNKRIAEQAAAERVLNLLKDGIK